VKDYYNLFILSSSGGAVVNLGDEPQWIDKYRKALDCADIICLTPKDKKSGLPIVEIEIGSDRKWIFYKTKLGRLNTADGSAEEKMLYNIGWRDTETFEVITVDPEGNIRLHRDNNFADILSTLNAKDKANK